MLLQEATWFALAVQIVGFVVWIVRLEGKVNALKDRHDACEIRRQLNEDKVINRLDRLDVHLAELTNDIKWLVSSQNKPGMVSRNEEDS